jgi:hypothetical protein
MKTGKEYCEERGLYFEAFLGCAVPAEEFTKRKIPLVVVCNGCNMSLAFPNSYIEDNHVYCGDCAEVYIERPGYIERPLLEKPLKPFQNEQYEYITREVPFSTEVLGSNFDCEYNQWNWKRVWADITVNGCFIVYRRERLTDKK